MKRPVDLLEHDAIIGIEPEVRWLFSCVFDRATRLPREMLGFLLDASGSPAGVRTIARWSSLPRSTTQRYLLELQTAGLVELDIFGMRKVPLVISTERRFTRSEQSSTTPSDGVDNVVAHTPQNEGGVPESGPIWDASPPPLLIALSDSESLRTDIEERPGENTAPEPARYDLLPRQLEGTATGHCLAKLGAANPAWGKALRDPRDRANLIALHGQHPGHLYDLVAEQLQNPTAQNPLGFLNYAVADRVREAVS